MRIHLRALLVLLATAVLAMPAVARAETRPLLHPLFTDHAVLQRGVAVPVWGWAPAGSRVRVVFGAAAPVDAVAGADGLWRATLPAMAASAEGRTLVVTVALPSGETRTLSARDVVVGEVWLCSGQSNMEFPVEHAKDAAAELAAARVPGVRMFTTARTASGVPIESPAGGYSAWAPATPDTARAFSAVGYFFGRRVHEALGVPVGLLHTSWGGTPIEAWTSAEALARAPVTSSMASDLAADTSAWEAAHRDGPAALERFFAARDPGSAGAAWADPRVDDTAWLAPAGHARSWRDMGVTQDGGIVWYRRAVDVPDAWAGKDLTLSLGPITVRDRTWFNGQVVGDTLMPWESRTYTVPGALVRPGRNVIAVRVLADGDNGGFAGAPAQMTLAKAPVGQGFGPATPDATNGDRDLAIPLAEGWRLAPGLDAAALGRVPALLGIDPWAPAALYNGKVAPLLPYALRGFLWYQGEQNTSAPERYGPMLESMIADWRARFGGGDLPFGIVQLANFGARSPEPWDSGWAALRDEQRKTIGHVPATGLAVTIDIGDAADIHPKNKQDVGRRLASWALATVYGRGGEWSGPLYRAAAIDGGRIRVEFDHVGKGLVGRGATLAGFEIAGPDRRFVRADARIDGSVVVVSSPSVPAPAAVRYAWDDDPEVSLFNADGLPASPFRTDDWPRLRSADRD